MRSVFITGSSGFIGTNLKKYFNKQYSFTEFNKNQKKIEISEEIVIHLAGKAHDLKKVSSEIDYYRINTELTKQVFSTFLKSNAKIFIFLSSVKAAVDQLDEILTEDYESKPTTHYGKSKLLAEEYILNNSNTKGKKVYILRPCMIHGPGNKGNLNSLYKIVSKGFPWPLGAFENKRSFCSIDNLMFIIKELIEREDIPSGVYNIADDEALSTNDVISILAESQNRKAKVWKVSKGLIQFLAKLGDVFRLPLTTERLKKLTESYVVGNQKIKSAIGKPLPVSAKNGLLKTFNSFHNSAQ
jgi:nucleoside-diphosphate-sugar epimerase